MTEWGLKKQYVELLKSFRIFMSITRKFQCLKAKGFIIYVWQILANYQKLILLIHFYNLYLFDIESHVSLSKQIIEYRSKIEVWWNFNT